MNIIVPIKVLADDQDIVVAKKIFFEKQFEAAAAKAQQ